MNRCPCLAAAALLAASLNAQEKAAEPAAAPPPAWQKEMVASLQLTQTGFDNWAQGGDNSAAYQAGLAFKFNRDRERTAWTNSGKLTYGETKVGRQESRKSIDEVKLESVFTVKVGAHINPFVAATAETQFAPGIAYAAPGRPETSAFMDPGYFRQSAGAGFKPNETVSTRLGLSVKETVTSEHPAPYADDPATAGVEKTRIEAGAESVTDLRWKVSASAQLTSKLELFTNLKAVDEIDVNWDSVLSASVSKYVSLNLNFRLVYDKTVSVRRQIKQALAVGFSYRLL
jgi:hypothetical protein